MELFGLVGLIVFLIIWSIGAVNGVVAVCDKDAKKAEARMMNTGKIWALAALVALFTVAGLFSF